MIVNNNKSQLNGTSDEIDIQIAKLAFIGASLTTLGDGLTAIAAGLALEALVKKSNNQSSQSQNKQLKQIQATQRQLDYLITELNQFKKINK